MSVSELNVVVGLGASGYACVDFLKRQDLPVAIMDTRESPPNLHQLKASYPDTPLHLSGWDEELLSRSSRIILSPGISLKQPEIAAQIKRGKPVIGDIELFAQVCQAPVIAITGTNAKSTVTSLVADMAERAGVNMAVGGNLGTPALELLMQKPDASLYILELSSFQLETTYSLKAKVATVLNVSPDHMDRYETLAEYQQAKLRIYQGCELAVCNRDDPLTETHHSQKLYFSLAQPGAKTFGRIRKNNEEYLAYEDQCLLACKALPILGTHYQANALAALALGKGIQLDTDAMISSLKHFKGLAHRCQFVRKKEDVVWINDSKGTNVGATIAAIEGLGHGMQGKIILIAGGIGKNADFSPLLPTMQKYVRALVLIGEAAPELARLVNGHLPYQFADSMQAAITAAQALAHKHDYVLLSPACASFDMFKHFEHRGDVFMQWVNQL